MANYYSKQAQGIQQNSEKQFGQFDQNYQDFLNMQATNVGGFGDEMKNAYNMGGGGLQGYTPEQQAAILGVDPATGRLAGVGPGATPMTDQERNDLNLTPGEVQSILGDPSSVRQQAASGGQSIMDAVGPQSQFQLSPEYQKYVNDTLTQEGDTLTGAANNPNLGLSGEFNQNYQFGPEDAQRLVTQAGTTVGNQYATALDQATRSAEAQGQTSPAAMAAIRGRLLRQSAADQGNAMSQARIAAKNEELGVAQNREQMRLGTAQDISSRQLQAGETLGSTKLGAANSAQQMALQGAEFGAGARTRAAAQAASMGMSAAEYADTAASQRSAGIASNRQQTAEYGQAAQFGQNFQNTGQQMQQNSMVSGRQQKIADTSQGQQQTYRDWLSGQYGGAMNSYQQGLQQRSNTSAQGTGLAYQGTGLAYNTQSPGLFSQIMSGAGAAAGTAAKAFAK